MKIIRLLVVLMALCLLFVGCNNEPDSVPTIADDLSASPVQPAFNRGGVRFNLPEEFSDYSQSPMGQNYEFLYADSFVGIYGLKDNSGGLDEEIDSLEAFVAAQAEKHGAEPTQKEDYWVFSYEDLEQNEPQMMVCAFYEVGDFYWSIYSYCPSDLFESSSEAMWGYITSPVFE